MFHGTFPIEKGVNMERDGENRISVRGKVQWKGRGEEAISEMGEKELLDYVNMLERAIFEIHEHFYYLSPRVEVGGDGIDGVRVEDIGFDGNWRLIGAVALSASLRMYRVHSVPFVPVQRPKGVGKVI